MNNFLINQLRHACESNRLTAQIHSWEASKAIINDVVVKMTSFQHPGRGQEPFILSASGAEAVFRYDPQEAVKRLAPSGTPETAWYTMYDFVAKLICAITNLDVGWNAREEVFILSDPFPIEPPKSARPLYRAEDSFQSRDGEDAHRERAPSHNLFELPTALSPPEAAGPTDNTPGESKAAKKSRRTPGESKAAKISKSTTPGVSKVSRSTPGALTAAEIPPEGFNKSCGLSTIKVTKLPPKDLSNLFSINTPKSSPKVLSNLFGPPKTQPPSLKVSRNLTTDLLDESNAPKSADVSSKISFSRIFSPPSGLSGPPKIQPPPLNVSKNLTDLLDESNASKFADVSSKSIFSQPPPLKVSKNLTDLLDESNAAKFANVSSKSIFSPPKRTRSPPEMFPTLDYLLR